MLHVIGFVDNGAGRLPRRAELVRFKAIWAYLGIGSLWPTGDFAVTSLRCPDVSEDVVGKKSRGNAVALSRSVGRTLPNFEYSSGAYEVLLASTSQECSLHVRRDPVFVGSSLRHDR